MDNNSLGTYNELSVASDLSRHGKVSIPAGEFVYDLILDYNNELYKVQVKSAQRTGQRNNAHTVHIQHGSNYRNYGHSEFDILAVTAKGFDKIAYWPWTKGSVRRTLTIWFDREPKDFRPCNRDMANIATAMSVSSAIESLK